jgi:uncharacterized alpha-E superfamily protein
MMLSRVATSLYWMGRYLERSENVTRMLLVTSEVSIDFEGMDAKLAQAQWDELARSLPGSEVSQQGFTAEEGVGAPWIHSFLLGQDNPMSVLNSLGKARENGRAVREALTREVFLNLNEAYRALDDRRRARTRNPVATLAAVSDTHRTILTTLGAMEHTLTRDQGWTFLKLGEAIERTLRTLEVLRVKLPGLQGSSSDVDLPLFYARWRALLRSIASLENFRRVHGAGLDPSAVLRFLLFDAAAPRSVRCGVVRMKNYLDQLPSRGGMSQAQRVIGKALATVSYDDDRIMAASDIGEACDELIRQLAAVHAALERHYFAA